MCWQANCAGIGRPTPLSELQSRLRIPLPPVRINRAGAVRAKLAEMGITESDVADAVK